MTGFVKTTLYLLLVSVFISPSVLSARPYASVKYSVIRKENPKVANISWLRWLKLDWFQLVPFIEGERVASDYDFSELFSDWKVDGGIGVRSMVAVAVVRFDMAVSDEGSAAWVMFSHPF